MQIELSTRTQPPSATSPSNISSDGWFIATSTFGCSTVGEPMRSLQMFTEQLAVPPRISGP